MNGKKIFLLALLALVGALGLDVGTAEAVGGITSATASQGTFSDKIRVVLTTDTPLRTGIVYLWANGNCSGFSSVTKGPGENLASAIIDWTGAPQGDIQAMSFKHQDSLSLAYSECYGPVYGYKAPALAPTNIEASDDVLPRVSVTWAPSASGGSGLTYEIGRGAWNSTSPSQTLKSNETGTFYHDTTAAIGVSYKYFVSSCNDTADRGRVCGDPKPNGGVIGYRPVGKATNITASDGLTTGINVSWTKPAGGVYSAVYRCASAVHNSSCVPLTSGGFTGTSLVDTGGNYNYNYYYSIDSAGENGWYSGPQISTDTGYWTQPVTTPSLTLTSVSSGCQGVTPYVSASWTGRSTNTWLKISPNNSMAPYWDHFVASGSSYTPTSGLPAYSASQAGIISPLVLTAGNTYYVQVTDGVSTASPARLVTAASCATPGPYTLTINKQGSGTGNVTKNPDRASYSSATPVTLTAQPTGSSTWGGWGGDCAGSGLSTTCSLVMTSNKTVTATFNGDTTSPPPPPGVFDFSITTGGDRTVNKGDAVTNSVTVTTITGTPAADLFFGASWDPAPPPGVTSSFSPVSCRPNNSCTVTMTIQTSNLTPVGSYNVSAVASGNGREHLSPFVLRVTELAPSICLPNVDDWVAPTTAPPGSDAAGPLNTNANSQYKTGCLNLGSQTEVVPTFPLQVDGSALVTGTLVAGAIKANTVNAGTVTETSDARLKMAITPLAASVRALVMKLNPVSFAWLRDGKPGLGLIAQEVEPLFPEVVDTDALDYKTLDYSALAAPLVKTVQEQRREIEALRQQIEALGIAN
jgi:hypothetical protein